MADRRTPAQPWQLDRDQATHWGQVECALDALPLDHERVLRWLYGIGGHRLDRYEVARRLLLDLAEVTEIETEALKLVGARLISEHSCSNQYLDSAQREALVQDAA